MKIIFFPKKEKKKKLSFFERNPEKNTPRLIYTSIFCIIHT